MKVQVLVSCQDYLSAENLLDFDSGYPNIHLPTGS